MPLGRDREDALPPGTYYSLKIMIIMVIVTKMPQGVLKQMPSIILMRSYVLNEKKSLSSVARPTVVVDLNHKSKDIFSHRRNSCCVTIGLLGVYKSTHNSHTEFNFRSSIDLYTIWWILVNAFFDQDV